MRSTVAPSSDPRWKRNAFDRIDRQAELVALMQPGPEAHRRATEVLLTLRDSLHVMTEAMALIESIRRQDATD